MRKRAKVIQEAEEKTDSNKLKDDLEITGTRSGEIFSDKPAKSNLTMTQRMALEARRRFGSTTETYVAYGATEVLYKNCAKQADYSVPQASQEGIEIPKTKYGEDMGVGDSWWYKGQLLPF